MSHKDKLGDKMPKGKKSDAELKKQADKAVLWKAADKLRKSNWCQN